jgi:hypothetical protein
MTDRERRRELTDDYRQARAEAGIYRITNTRSGRGIVASSTNLPSIRNRFDFARSTGSYSALDNRLQADAKALGIEALELEILEVVAQPATMTRFELVRELEVLEALWREKLEAGARS